MMNIVMALQVAEITQVWTGPAWQLSNSKSMSFEINRKSPTGTSSLTWAWDSFYIRNITQSFYFFHNYHIFSFKQHSMPLQDIPAFTLCRTTAGLWLDRSFSLSWAQQLGFIHFYEIIFSLAIIFSVQFKNWYRIFRHCMQCKIHCNNGKIFSHPSSAIPQSLP